ncbi:MAG TPA: hemerythrin domain-containing protein [Anaerolineales bacterium]|nr:hemerythrin domain-containing protein [Anaerolineales bacterium]
MTSLTQPLRDEHKELYPQVETLRLAGDAVYESLTTNAHAKIEEAYHFLTHDLIPHAQAEEKALYPTVQKAMGAPQATATMSRDHVEVERLTEELGTLRVHSSLLSITSIHAMALRRVLYGLYTLVKVHFAKEEEVYLPLLDAKLTAEEAREMFGRMEAAAREAKARLSH